MGTTPGGLVYPASTDAVDIAGDLQSLAESAEAGLTRITTTGSVTPGTGWSVTTFNAKIIGGLCWVRIIASRTGAAITVSATDVTQGVLSPVSTIGTIIPTAYWPQFTCGLAHAGNGRAGAAGYVDVSGNIVLQSIGVNDSTTPSPNIATNTAISLGGVYPLMA